LLKTRGPSGVEPVGSRMKRRRTMMKTDASIRRFLKIQELMHRDAPPKLVDRYECYVWCVARTEFPKSFKEWIND
jgi:hypothetical protein